MVSAF